MNFPAISLCTDRKRSLNPFLMFGKSKNSSVNKVTTMFDNGGVVFQTQSDCQSDYLSSKTPKFNGFFAKSYNTSSPFIASFSIIGGFLGSKSQVRSNINQDQCVWDFIKFAENLSKSNPEIISDSKDQFTSNAAPSPPKKKFAKEDFLDINEIKIDALARESVGCASTAAVADCPKQSYAEVAKSICSRSLPVCESKQTSTSSKGHSAISNSHQRRQQSLQRRSNYRKHNRRERRKLPLQNSFGCLSGPSLVETKEDLHKQCKTVVSQSRIFPDSPLRSCSGPQTNLKYSTERNSGESDCRQQFACVNKDQHSNFLPDIRRKRRAKGSRNNCDIESFNWRTGEPIYPNMHINSVSEDNRTAEQVTGNKEHISIPEDRDYGSNKLKEHNTDAVPCSEQLSSQIWNRRRSLSSECSLDSEDSFIVFQSGALSDSVSDTSLNWSDCDSDDSCEDDSDSLVETDLFDGCGLSPASQRLQQINFQWENDSRTSVTSETTNQQPCQSKLQSIRKVHFMPSKPKVHWMLAWDYAYRASRVGPWEEMARDRVRFQSRIQQFEMLLSPILNSDHRDRVWKQLHSQC